MKSAIITCPKCGHKQDIEIPDNSCLPFYRCDGCQEIVTIPQSLDNCCVICEYSDQECPTPKKKA